MKLGQAQNKAILLGRRIIIQIYYIIFPHKCQVFFAFIGKRAELSVKRDRNHPSIILWSTGNEKISYHTKEQGVNIQRAMAPEVKKHDPNRPVTSAVAYAKIGKATLFAYAEGLKTATCDFEVVKK